MRDYAETAHCPKCGRFVTGIRGVATRESLRKVLGRCAVHGEVTNPRRVVDGAEVGWGWDDFFTDQCFTLGGSPLGPGWTCETTRRDVVLR